MFSSSCFQFKDRQIRRRNRTIKRIGNVEERKDEAKEENEGDVKWHEEILFIHSNPGQEPCRL